MNIDILMAIVVLVVKLGKVLSNSVVLSYLRNAFLIF